MLVCTPGAHAVILVVDRQSCLAHGYMHGFHSFAIQSQETGVEALCEVQCGLIIHWPCGTDKILYTPGKERLSKAGSQLGRALLRSIRRNPGLAGIGEDEFGNTIDPAQLIGTETLAAGEDPARG